MGTRSKKKNGTTTPTLISLSAEQIKRLARPHTGFDQFAEELLALYEANVDKLFVTGLDVGAVRESLQAMQNLRPVRVAAQNQLDLVDGTQLYHSSIVWSALLEIYAHGKSSGRTDADIERGIAPFATFMKNRPHKKRAASTTTPTTPTTP